MTIHRYMLSDCGGILISFFLFAVLVLPPGYAVGWLLNVVQFRNRTPLCRLALSVALSIAAGPVFSYLTALSFSLDLTVLIYLAIFVCVSVHAVRRWRGAAVLTESAGPFTGLFLAWVVIAVFSLIDLQIGKRLYFSVTSLDYAVRTAFTSSIGAFGIPAQNPFFFPGHSVGLRYHYFWLIQSAIVQRLGCGSMNPRHALIGGTIWCGFGLFGVAALYLRFFSEQGSTRLLERAQFSISLMAVTGLDLFPALVLLLLARLKLIAILPPSAEWWNEQVDGFVYSMIWEPHYVASLIACLTGFLLIWQDREHRPASSVLAGIAFATALGSAFMWPWSLRFSCCVGCA